LVEILHVSDTHLGLQAYNRLTSEGLNQREMDFQDAFGRFVDEALRSPPDLVVHSGDLFDVVRPSNRAIAFALQQVRRLSQAGIPTVLVSGNHEAPRLRETGCIFRVFEGLPYVHPVYRGEYEALRLSTRSGDVIVHAVPQTLAQADFSQELMKAAPKGSEPQILVAHGTVAGVEGLFMNELNELTIPANALRPEYDYIALGHFHNHRRIGPNGAYAGSTERTSFAEANEEKVFLRVQAGAGSPKIQPIPTGARPMRDAGRLDAHGLQGGEITAQASERLAVVTGPGAIVRLKIHGMDPATLRTVDVAEIRSAAAEAIHVDLKFEPRIDAHATQSVPELGSLEAELEAFLATKPMPGINREAVAAQARLYLRTEADRAA
jgi:DNA repair protein SbcD/Mre11